MAEERISEHCLRCIREKQEKNYSLVAPELRDAYREEIEAVIEARSPEDCSPVLVARLNKVHEKYLGTADIYREIKQKYNHMMLGLSDEIRSIIEQSDDPLSQALVYARAGNFIDFGAMHEVDDDVMAELLTEAPKLVPEPEVYEAFTSQLASAKRLVYLTDNCGEIVLDKLLMEQIRRQYPALEVTVIVRGGAVINDATMEDAAAVGLTELPGVHVIGNGTDIAGTELSRISPEALSAVRGADLIISKGQGNFESLHGCGLNIYYLFLCKCDWFTGNLGLPKLSGVFENERELVKRWKNGKFQTA